jgi:predicted DNA binding CopG/RHH family protein
MRLPFAVSFAVSVRLSSEMLTSIKVGALIRSMPLAQRLV